MRLVTWPRAALPLLLALLLALLAHGALWAGVPDPELRRAAAAWKLAAVHGQPAAAALAWSPDGRHLYTAGKDDVLRVWDAAALHLLQTWGHDGGHLRHVAPSPDGRRVVVGDTDGTLTVRELATGEVVQRQQGSGRPVIGLGWSPDGTRIASATLFGPIRERDAATGRPLSETGGSSEWFGAVRFHLPSGLAAATGKDGDVRVFQLQTGQLLRTLPVEPGRAAHFLFSADGRRLAIANELGEVLVWDPLSGRVLQALHASAPLRGLSFGPDSSTLISPDTPDRLQIWSSRRDWALSELSAPPRWLGLSPEQSPAAPEPEEEEAVRYAGVAAGVSPDGTRLAEAWDGTLRVWDLASGRLLASRELGVAQVTAIDLAPRTGWLAAALDTGHVVVYSALEGARRAMLALPRGPARAVSFAPDGQTLAIAGADFHVRLWQVLQGQGATTLFGHEGPVLDVDFSPQGVLLSASADGTLGLWDVGTRQRTAAVDAHPQGVWRARWSRDGRQLAAWPVYEARPPAPPEGQPAPRVPRDAPRIYSASGELVQSALVPGSGRVGLLHGKVLLSTDTPRLHFVDLGTGQPQPGGGPGRIRALALSPDGRFLAAGAANGTVQLLDAQTGFLLIHLSGHGGPVTAVEFSEDGRLLASGSEDGTVRVWTF